MFLLKLMQQNRDSRVVLNGTVSYKIKVVAKCFHTIWPDRRYNLIDYFIFKSSGIVRVKSYKTSDNYLLQTIF